MPQQQDAFNIYLSSDDPMSLEPGYTDHRQAEYRFYNGDSGGAWNQAEMPAQIKASNVGVFYFTVCDTTDELPTNATISITFDHSPFSAAKTAALADGSAMQYQGQRPVEGVSGSHKTWIASLNSADFDTAAIGNGLSVEFTMVVDSTTKYYLDPKMIVRT